MLTTARFSEWEQELAEKLQSRAAEGWEIFCFHKIDSTMDAARRIMKDSSGHAPAVILSASQSAGRGRHGNLWEESRGALYLTAALPILNKDRDPGGFSLAVGCVLCDFFRALGCEVALKWPNDVLSLDGDKLAGILIELVDLPDARIVLVGIGANLLEAPAIPDAVSVYELSSREITAPEAAADICLRLIPVCDKFSQQGFSAFKADWLSRSLFLESEISVGRGEDKITGLFKGVNDSGFLLLETGGEVKEICSGEIFLS